MRIVLFYSGVESFNYFTERIDRELKRRNHETFILDLRNPSAENAHSYAKFSAFAEGQIDAAIGFDGLGMKDDLFIELWNVKNTVAVNILMDHPLRFHPTMEHHPKRYLQFCCDRNHVSYVRKYFSDAVEHVYFMPHAGTLPENQTIIPFEQRKYDILFSGTYYRPEEQLARINEWFPKASAMDCFYRTMAQHMLENSGCTTEQAALDTIEQGWDGVSDDRLKTIFRCAEPLDWMVRMYQREKVVRTLAEAGMDIWLLGRGWENHPSIRQENVHRVDDRIPFEQTLSYMAEARINLNVMPWFKAGTHDRIFNILLQHSIPLTDSSSWIDENYMDGEDIALYDLEHLEKLPQIAGQLLEEKDRTEEMIRRGYEKTRANYTWVNCVDETLEKLCSVG